MTTNSSLSADAQLLSDAMDLATATNQTTCNNCGEHDCEQCMKKEDLVFSPCKCNESTAGCPLCYDAPPEEPKLILCADCEFHPVSAADTICSFCQAIIDEASKPRCIGCKKILDDADSEDDSLCNECEISYTHAEDPGNLHRGRRPIPLLYGRR